MEDLSLGGGDGGYRGYGERAEQEAARGEQEAFDDDFDDGEDDFDDDFDGDFDDGEDDKDWH